jgi:DNA topoisomerase 2-associated protein PAT1
MGPTKGIRLLPRLLQHVDQKRASLFFTLLVACYRQLDVVRHAPLLDMPDAPPAAKADLEKQTALFMSTVLPICQSIVSGMGLRFVTGILGLILDGGNVLPLAQTPVRIALPADL